METSSARGLRRRNRCPLKSPFEPLGRSLIKSSPPAPQPPPPPECRSADGSRGEVYSLTLQRPRAADNSVGIQTPKGRPALAIWVGRNAIDAEWRRAICSAYSRAIAGGIDLRRDTAAFSPVSDIDTALAEGLRRARPEFRINLEFAMVQPLGRSRRIHANPGRPNCNFITICRHDARYECGLCGTAIHVFGYLQIRSVTPGSTNALRPGVNLTSQDTHVPMPYLATA
ncbi:MAG: hypothetical protein JWO52_1326 [Gammaproteobacteria bacterium]|nr:hypothetical protein [Gammaproteobacteria bacterium]